MKYIIACFLLGLMLGTGALADTGTGMQPAAGDEATMGVITPEFYLNTRARQDQTWIEKYQDLRSSVWSIGNLEYAGYNGPWQGFVRGWDVVTNNSYINTEFGYTDRLWVQAYTTTVTRRTPLFPLNPTRNPGEVLLPVVLQPFSVDDGRHDLSLSLRPVKSSDFTLVSDLWFQHVRGTRPLAFRTRVGTVARPNRTKFETTDPVDQDNSNPSFGADFHLGTAAMSFRTATQTYTNNVGGPVLTPDFAATEPIRNSRFDDTSNHSNTLKMSVPLGSKFAATGSWIRRERSHQTTGILLPDFANLAVPSNVGASIESVAGALRYTPMTNLLFTAKFRQYDYDRSAPEIVSAGILQNQSVSRNEKEWLGESTFTGLRHTTLHASYSLRDIDRQDRPVHEPVGSHTDPNQEEWEHPALALNTTHHMFRLGGSSYAIPRLTLRLDWKNDDISNPTFHGTPGSTDDVTASATYSLKDDFVLFADFRNNKDNNSTVPPPTFFNLASLADPTQYTARREAEAGAQFFNRTSTLNIGAYKSIGARLTADANFMYDKVNSRAYWILGDDATAPPHVGGQGDTTGLPPELTPYTARDQMWSLGATYAMAKGWNLRSNLLYGRTDGVTTTDSLFRLVAPVGDKPRDWQPIATAYWRAALGLSYKFKNGQQVLFEYSRNTWNDKIENQFDGSYDYFTFSMQTPF